LKKENDPFKNDLDYLYLQRKQVMTIVIKSIKSRSKTLKEGQNLLDEGLMD